MLDRLNNNCQFLYAQSDLLEIQLSVKKQKTIRFAIKINLQNEDIFNR